jgi:hypothetical protein
VCANVTLKILEVAEVVKDAHPELASRLPKKLLPNWLMKVRNPGVIQWCFSAIPQTTGSVSPNRAPDKWHASDY